MSAERPRCAVVGAANIDIGGFPSGMMAMRDSNPGRVRMSAGGVGRNIACNLARMGVETHLVTALGGDTFAEVARADCRAAGVMLEHALTFPEAASSVYLYIADAEGDMQLAVNDMGICDRLTPEALEARVDFLNAMDVVVLDANLPEASLAFLAHRLRPPLIADAVSAAKARKLLPALPGLRAIKPNALEAAALTGISVHDRESAGAAARALLDTGVQQVYITLGERGVCWADKGEIGFIPGSPIQMVNATGAGDAFTAALAWAELSGLDARAAAMAGLAAASMAVESEATVNPSMSELMLFRRIGDLGARMLGIENAPSNSIQPGGESHE